jgi:hypothetical protein
MKDELLLPTVLFVYAELSCGRPDIDRKQRSRLRPGIDPQTRDAFGSWLYCPTLPPSWSL